MWSRIASVAPAQRQQGVLAYQGFAHGLNTASPASQIASTECTELINFNILRGGTLETRRPLTRYIDSQITGSPKFFDQIPIGGTNYELTVGSDYKLYYNNSGTQTLIGTLEGDAQLLAYNGVALIFDGSYIKYLDGVSSIKMAYDDGTGTTGFQFDNSAGGDDGDLDLGNATNTRVGYKFTSQSWDVGYTIPPTTVTAILKRENNGFTGTDNVDVTVAIRKVSDDSAIATGTIIEAPIATNLSDTAAEYSATLTATAEMDPSTAYYVSIEYNNGDATNYVGVRCAGVASGGAAYTYAGSWSASATNDPLMSLSPGRPPKGSFGRVANRRAFVAGDSDNPGYVWFCNLTHLDWSTSDGGGYVGAIDDNKNNYEVGALISQYGDLYVIGTKAQPYLCQLTGSSPTNYALPALFQQVAGTNRTSMSVGNDAVFASSFGLNNLAGVQEYGDLRAIRVSDPVQDRWDSYWSDSAIGGYYPRLGQYFLSMPNHHRVLAFHITAPVTNPNGIGTRYPAVEMEYTLHGLTSSTYQWTLTSDSRYKVELSGGGDPSFDAEPDAVTLNGKLISKASAYNAMNDHEWWYGNVGDGYNQVIVKDASGNPDSTGVTIRTAIIPTSFSSFDNDFFIGCADGYIYHPDMDGYKEMSTHQIMFSLGTNITDMPLAHANFTDFQVIVESKGGGAFNANFSKNGERNSYHATHPYYVSMYDDILLSEAVMLVSEAQSYVDGTAHPLFKQINFNSRSVQVFLKDFTLAGYPLYINGFMLKYRVLGT